MACICPYIYIPYVIATYPDRCGIKWLQQMMGDVIQNSPPPYIYMYKT